MTVQYLKADDVIAVKTTEAPRFYSASGYGRAIPTQRMLQTRDKRWHRVYVCCYANSGTAYIKTKGDPFLVLSADVDDMFNAR